MLQFLYYGAMRLLNSLALLPVLSLLAAPLSAQPVRMSIEAFGVDVQIEVQDLPQEQATAAVEAALYEIHHLDKLLARDSPLPGSVGALNSAAGTTAIELDQQVVTVLVRSLQYCGWSNGAYGPLGGVLNDLWSDDKDLPNAIHLREAVQGAECSQLRIARDRGEGDSVTAILGEGTQVDLRGAARGYAVDRAVELLKQHGVENAWVEIAPVYRALGAGPEGNGWYLALPPTPGSDDPPEELWLRDQALGLLERKSRGTAEPRLLIDQRTGVPPVGVITVVTVASLAFDAEVLTHTLLIIGLSEGQRRLGSLHPRPSVRWLLGDRVGSVRPLESTYRWSEVARVKRSSTHSGPR
jgi:thiamine biosynthesis lipoprotein